MSSIGQAVGRVRHAAIFPDVRLPTLLLLILPGLALGLAPASAETLLARYEVQAGGLTVLRVDAVFDLDGPAYRVRTRSRTAGIAGWLASSDQTASAEGVWRSAEPLPGRYRSDGAWRDGRRQVAIDYPRGGPAAGLPLLRALEPPNEADREAVPQALTRDTVDALSALAKLLRAVAATGRCETAAAVYDGRRRVDWTARTEGLDLLPREGGFGGEALRCAVEGRLLAGRHADQDPTEARQPLPATAWLATVAPARRPLPVRIELPSRWFGSVRVVLREVLAGAAAVASGGPDPSGQDAAQQHR